MEVDERGLKRKLEEQLMPGGDEGMVAQLRSRRNPRNTSHEHA